MKLPHLENAFVPEAKIVKYLLNLEHTGGGKDKAIFFMRFGFTIEQWDVLEKALLAHAVAYDVASTIETSQGINYSIEGAIDTPDGRQPQIRTIWAVDKESTLPRLVTAYPL